MAKLALRWLPSSHVARRAACCTLLGDAYMAGVDLEDRWMKAVADRVAAGEER